MHATATSSAWSQPSPIRLFAYGLVVLSLLALLVTLLHRFLTERDPLGHIPGPFLARWSPLWIAYHARRGRRYLAVAEAHEKYGPVVRVAPNHISVSDKEAIPVIYSQGTGAFDKSPFYAAFVGSRASIFSTTDRQEHAHKRRLLSNAFAYRSIVSFEPLLQDRLQKLVEKFDELCKTGQVFDALLWFNYLAFDILSVLAFGEAIGMLDSGSDTVSVEQPDGTVVTDKHAITLVDEREHLAAVLGHHPSYRFLSKFIPDPFFLHGRKSWNGLNDLARLRVMKRLECPSDQEDILSKIIHGWTEDHGDLTPQQVDELIAETVTLLIAGSDTTSNSMTAIVHFLFTHPRVHQKLVSILEEAIPDGMPTHDQVKDIPYLQATIDEGLRIYAPAAIGLQRSVPEGGVMCCGQYFPAGTEMSVPAWTIQHDRDIWGDPEIFRPERWLADPTLQQYLLSFGKGPRACIGRNLAYMEMQLTLATLLLRYDIDLQSDVLETTEGFTHKPVRLMVKLRRRDVMA